MKLGILRSDEVCFAIFDQILNNKLLLLHSWSCWSRGKHSCIDLPPEEVLENECVVLNDSEYNTRHTDIGTVVLGDLSMAGCYVDWEVAKTIMNAGQNKA